MAILKAEVDGSNIKETIGLISRTDCEAGVADGKHVHTQINASNVWRVTHGLQKNPSVEVIDNYGNRIFCEVSYPIDDFVVELTFLHPKAGSAYFN